MHRCKVSVEGPVAVLEWLDAFGLEDLEEMLKAVIETPGFRDGTPLLIVEPGAGSGPSSRELEHSARILKDFTDRFGNRIAMAVKRDVHFGLGRMLETYCDLEGVAFRPFRDVTTAKRWLVTEEPLDLQ